MEQSNHNNPQQELIGHGAQARVYKVTREGQQAVVIKERLPKKYRHPQLDKKINQSRIKSEAKIMKRLEQKGVQVPTLVKIYQSTYSIEMQYIQGPKLKDYINDPARSQAQINQVLDSMGTVVRAVHEAGIIHGDLTTSNMILDHNNKIVLIDFGLSYFKQSAEDRAVDLYVLERAFKSTHPNLQQQFKRVLTTYSQEAALKKLEVVRQRGRKKVAFG